MLAFSFWKNLRSSNQEQQKLEGIGKEIYDLIWLASCLLPPIVGLLFAPKLTKEILKDLRIPRIINYIALACMGIALVLRAPEMRHFLSDFDFWLRFGVMVMGLTYAAVFAIVTNNIADLAADKISNPDRPLVQAQVNQKSYLVAGIFCLAFALLISFLVQIELFWGILAISSGYFIYSCKPFRLKSVPLLAKLMIGFNALSVALMGYAMAGGDWLAFPLSWLFFILVPLSLAANFIDLKDIEGDRATGIKTIPVLIGETNAKHFMAISALACYLYGGYLLNIWWVWPINIGGAIAHIFFLYRKPFSEKMVFLILITALFGLDLFLFFTDKSF